MNHAVTIPFWIWVLWSMGLFCLGIGSGWWVWTGVFVQRPSVHARTTLRMPPAVQRAHADKCRGDHG